MKRTIKTEKIHMTSDFECGNGTDFEQMGENHFKFRPVQDSGEGYGAGAHYFCIRVTNLNSQAQKLKLDVDAVIEPIWDGWSAALESDVLVRRGDAWSQLPREMFETTRERIRMEFTLGGGEMICLSNMFWHPYTEMVEWLETRAEEHPSMCRLQSIGETVDQRRIHLLTIAEPITDEDRKRVLIAGTMQANEMGDWACRWVIEDLLGNDPFMESLRRKYIFDFIPQPNPDGVAQGTCMVNALGQNPMFDFGAAAAGEVCSREATAMWRWVKEHTPALFLEYHNFFQYKRRAKLYVYDPALLPTDDLREADKKISDAMSAAWEDSDVDFIQVGHDLFCDILAYKLPEHFGTLAHAYKLHTRYTFEENRDIALRVFRAIMEVYDSIDT